MIYRTQLRSRGTARRSGAPAVRFGAPAGRNVGAHSVGVEFRHRARADMLMWTAKVAAQFGRWRPGRR